MRRAHDSLLLALSVALASCSLDFKRFDFAEQGDGGSKQKRSGIADDDDKDASASDRGRDAAQTPVRGMDAATSGGARDDGGDTGSSSEPDASTTDMPDGSTSTPDAMVSMPTDCMPDQLDVCASDEDGKTIVGLTPERDGLGPCALGEKRCGADGLWGPCVGAVGPSARDCESSADNDCDGAPDDTIDSACRCNAAHPTVDCTAANNCAGVRSCSADHQLGPCEAPAACDCVSGERGCSGGPNDCPGGSQSCGTDHTWGPCTGAPDHCECSAGQTKPCTALPGAQPCGNATCNGGQWDTSSCTATQEWCQDLDGDGTCSTLCTLQCSGSATQKTNCPKTDCDDNDGNVNPTTPADCTDAKSCVKQVIAFSASSGKCECSNTSSAVHAGVECATYSVCANGACTCNAYADCQVGCQVGVVDCTTGTATCSSLSDAPAGTPCGTGSSYCNGSNACYTSCTFGSSGCVARAGCVSGSIRINCAEGSMCRIDYLPFGSKCISPPNTYCEEDHSCVQ